MKGVIQDCSLTICLGFFFFQLLSSRKKSRGHVHTIYPCVATYLKVHLNNIDVISPKYIDTFKNNIKSFETNW